MPLQSERIGFARRNDSQLVLVLQVDQATEVLATAVVAPVEDRFDPDLMLPFDVVIPAREAQAKRDHVVHVHLLKAVRVDGLKVVKEGSLSSHTLAAVVRAERLLLG